MNIPTGARPLATGSRSVFFGWWVVFGAIIGLSIGPGQFAFGSLGLIMVPLNQEFGWNRAEISLAFTILTVAMALTMPAVGILVDRYGSRRVVIPSLLTFALLLGLMSLAYRLWHIWAIFALIGSASVGANSLPYLRTISAWFNRRRGLALGVALMGNGLGAFYAAQVVRSTAEAGGWRTAYLVLSMTVLAGIVIVWCLLKESPAEMGLKPDGDQNAVVETNHSPTSGMSRIEVLAMPTFWLLFLIFAILSFSLYGLLPHLAPMLIDRGVSPGTATSTAGMVGISSLLARGVGGYLLDRINPRLVAFACILVSALGIGLLAAQHSVLALIWTAVVLISFGLGAEMDLLAYLTGRYFGLKYFGQNYGVLFISLMIGVALGPVAFGYAYESQREYAGILTACSIATAAAALSTFLLPAIRALARKE